MVSPPVRQLADQRSSPAEPAPLAPTFASGTMRRDRRVSLPPAPLLTAEPTSIGDFDHRILSYTQVRREKKIRIRSVSANMFVLPGKANVILIA